MRLLSMKKFGYLDYVEYVTQVYGAMSRSGQVISNTQPIQTVNPLYARCDS
jgi:hypothetical protein